METLLDPTPEQAMNLLIQVASMVTLNMQDNEKLRLAIKIVNGALTPPKETK